MIDLFSTAVTNRKSEYRFKPCCPNSLLYFCVEGWSYRCSPGGHGITMGSTRSMDKPCFFGSSLHVPQGLCGPQEKRAVRLHCNTFCFPSQTSHICVSSWPWIVYIPFYGLSIWKVVIIYVFEHKPWWDWTTCLKFLFFLLIEYH